MGRGDANYLYQVLRFGTALAVALLPAWFSLITDNQSYSCDLSTQNQYLLTQYVGAQNTVLCLYGENIFFGDKRAISLRAANKYWQRRKLH